MPVSSQPLVERLLVRNAQLEQALRSRVVIEQAKGVLAERFRLGLEEAFELLRRAARSQRIRIHALAAAVVSSETTPPQIEQLYQNTSANRVRTREGAMVGRRNGDELDGLRRDPVEDLRRQGESTVVCLAGEIDLYNAEAVRKALRKACTGAGAVVVDLSSVEFADSTTIGILLEARSRLGGRALKLVGPPPQVIHALELCGLDGRLPIYATLADALSA